MTAGSRLSRAIFGLVSASFLVAGISASMAQDAGTQNAGLARGDAVVTGFSGIKPSDQPLPPGANPIDHFFIDLDGVTAQIFSITALGGPANGQVVTPAAKIKIKARDIGQVFAITLDESEASNPPNIYLGATSAYGIHIVGPDSDGNGEPDRIKTGRAGAKFMPGQFGPGPDGNPGTIWRVDGLTGTVTAFATVPGNSGPGLGDIVFDKRSRHLYASDLDQGLIHRIGPDGIVIDTFDHGMVGRPAHGLPPLADDGTVMVIESADFDSENPETWGFTQKDRMVYGMAIHDGRLYYAVSGGQQIWSIGLGNDGSFGGDVRWELDATGMAGDGPITAITFDPQGRMLLAQRGAQRSSYDYSVFAEPGQGAVVRFEKEQPDNPGTPSIWQSDAASFAIGMPAPHQSADGGIALGYAHDNSGSLKPGTCSAMLWSTGSRLRSSDNPNEVDAGELANADMHGLQGNDANLTRPQNEPPSAAYFSDFDSLLGDPEKSGHMGDVAIWQPCDAVQFGQSSGEGGLPPGYFPPGEPPELPPVFPPPEREFNTNLRLTKYASTQPCLPFGAYFYCRYQVRVRNTGPDFYFGPLLVNDFLPAALAGALMGFGGNPAWNCWNAGPSDFRCLRNNTFLAPGASVSLTVAVLVPNTYQQCFLQNVAQIEWAPGGTRWNTDPTDDVDSATALIPAENCPPPVGPTNLQLSKIADPETCLPVGAGYFNCRYRVTVTNTGPGQYSGPLQVFEEPTVGTATLFTWPCVPTGNGHTCTLGPLTLQPAEQRFLWVWVRVTAQEARANDCRIENRARITFAPGGSFQNTNPADDDDTAVAVVGGNICPSTINSLVTPPPLPPPFTCPPGYVLTGGKCERRVRVCPEGMVGKYPDCRTRIVDPPKVCPLGTRGIYPRCREIEPPKVCPPGTRGIYPRCRGIEPPQVCPPGTLGRFPSCREIEPPKVCPPGTRGIYPRCRGIEPPQVCPPGTVGRFPRCRKIEPPKVCPPGTVGRFPRCLPIRCAHGMVGKPPNCRPRVTNPPKICPPGTRGRWPNCGQAVVRPRPDNRRFDDRQLRRQFDERR